MSNYKAIIAKIDKTIEIEGANTIQIGKVLGESVIINKATQEGTIGVYFCAGTQLSEKYCHVNNLYRDSNKNLNTKETGFFEDTRRVRAQPFMKVRSEGYFAPLNSLSYTGFDIDSLKVGDEFEELAGVEVCKKYILKVKENQLPTKKKKAREIPDFHPHVDTAQYARNKYQIEVGDVISIQSKIHGTSARYGYHKVERSLPRWKEVINKLLPIFPTTQWEYTVGTRRVILDNPEKEGFHGKEEYRFEVMEKLKPYLTKGMTVYGEIAGYVNGKPIMPNHDVSVLKDKKYTKKYGNSITYKYNCVETDYRFHIYRITLTTEGGEAIDLTQPQLVKWCEDRGFVPAHDVIPSFVYYGGQDNLDELVEALTERPEVLTEDYHDPSQISEGVIIRIDKSGLEPVFLKNKSYAFKVMEGIASEKGTDIEELS